MTKQIDPALVTSVLEVLPIIGLAPEDTWAEVQCIELASGDTAVALNVRLVLDDGLLVRHISKVKPDEDLHEAVTRIADDMKHAGMRSIDIVEGMVDYDEPFHSQESVRNLMAMTATVVSPSLH